MQRCGKEPTWTRCSTSRQKTNAAKQVRSTSCFVSSVRVRLHMTMMMRSISKSTVHSAFASTDGSTSSSYRKTTSFQLEPCSHTNVFAVTHLVGWMYAADGLTSMYSA